MRKSLLFFGILFVSVMLASCGGTEIDRNPMPIVWGKLSFFPETVEKGGGKTILNNVAFAGYGKKGTIGRVVVARGEIQVENLKSDFWSSEKQIFKDLSGKCKEALIFVMSGDFENMFQDSGNNAAPDCRIGSYQATGDKWFEEAGVTEYGSIRAEDISFAGLSGLESKDIVYTGKNGEKVTIAEAGLARLYLPPDVDENPEKMIIDGLRLKNMAAPELKAKAEELFLDYKASKLNFGIEKASVPGVILKEWGVNNPPAMIRGSLNGEGEVKNGEYNAEADLSLDSLFDLEAAAKGSIVAEMPDEVTFTLKDNGVIRYISQEHKAQLAILSMFVPNAQEAIIGFLSKPRQTLEGSLNFSGGVPDLKFSLR